MTVNQALETVVVRAMARELKRQGVIDEQVPDEDMGDLLLMSLIDTGVDEEGKIRLHLGPMIAYGYDFSKTRNGEPAKTAYERAVSNTRKLSGRKGLFEEFVSSGIEEDRFGWYVTRLPR